MNNQLVPLVVDLDDTLVFTDTLHENIITLLKNKPFSIFTLLSQLKNGRAAFKEYVYQNSNFDATVLPYNQDLLNYIQEEKSKGRTIVLATAAYEEIAYKVADYAGCFDKVIATNKTRNLKGEHKLTAIKNEFGDQFIYAGDHQVDLAVWGGGQGAIVVGNKVDELVAVLEKQGTPVIEKFYKEKATLKTWFKAIRIHQWLKNALLFVPLLTSFQIFNLEKLFLVFIAFIAFSLGASATYIFNDLWDLTSDRKHKRKCKRPFAAGIISIPDALKTGLILLGVALIISYIVSVYFLGIFILYLVITTLYSLKLKKQVLVDITVLSILYTMRVFAGGIVSQTNLSYWLVSFSVLIFLSLATMKRCAELVAMKEDKIEIIVGRGYTKSDLEILFPLGISTYIGAIILFGLYINEPSILPYYAHPNILWAVQLILFYLVGNLWIKTKYGAMHDDPIIYLIKDKKSLFLIVIMCILVLLSHYGF